MENIWPALYLTDRKQLQEEEEKLSTNIVAKKNSNKVNTTSC